MSRGKGAKAKLVSKNIAWITAINNEFVLWSKVRSQGDLKRTEKVVQQLMVDCAASTQGDESLKDYTKDFDSFKRQCGR